MKIFSTVFVLAIVSCQGFEGPAITEPMIEESKAGLTEPSSMMEMSLNRLKE